MSSTIILASASPRRRELISLLGIPVTIESSRYEEPPAPATVVSLPDLVISLATEKAREVAARLQITGSIVIGADTLVTLSTGDMGVPLGKPADLNDARRMLRELSGNSHFVYTGLALAIYRDGAVAVASTAYERTTVRFRPLTEEMILQYLNTGEPMDKAGAYGAQGYASPFIESFHGDFYNVVGLPLCTLGKLLEEIGYNWSSQRSPEHMPEVTA